MKRIISFYIIFSLLANPVFAQNTSSLRPPSFSESSLSGPQKAANPFNQPAAPAQEGEGVVSNRLRSVIRNTLSSLGVLTTKEVNELAKGISWRTSMTGPLYMRRNFIRLIAKIEGTAPINVLKRGVYHERMHNLLDTLSIFELSRVLASLSKNMEGVDKDFKAKFEKEYGVFRQEFAGKSANALYLEEVIIEYYSEKVRLGGRKLPLFSTVASVIEDTMKQYKLNPDLINKLPGPMRERPPENFHELFDLEAGYDVSLKTGMAKDALDLKLKQLLAITKAAGLTTRIKTLSDMNEAIERASRELDAVLSGGVQYLPALVRSDGSFAEIETSSRDIQTLDDIATVCLQRQVAMIHVCVVDSETKQTISYTIASGDRITELLTRGESIDGSSLDRDALLHIFGKEGLPTIGRSDIRGMVVASTFRLLKMGEDDKYQEAYVEVSLHQTDDPTISEPRRISVAPQPRAFIECDTASEVEDAIVANGITHLTVLYSDFGPESKEHEIEATSPEELVERLRTEDIFSKGIRFYGDMTRDFQGARFLMSVGNLVIVPKPPTFRIVNLPQGPWAVIVGQFQLEDSKSDDPWTEVPVLRNWLKTVSDYGRDKKRKDKGENVVASPEIEFYLEIGGPVMGEVGYHRMFYGTPYEKVIKDMFSALEGIGETVKYVHAEVGSTPHSAQFEFVLGHGKAFKTITTKEMHRWVLTKVAEQHRFRINFKPKPYPSRGGKPGKAGNGMHVHLSMEEVNPRTGEMVNTFFDRNDPRNLSKVARQFIAGLIKYLPEIMFLTNQSDNSYLRLGVSEAPGNIAWGMENRTAAIRIPAFIDPQVDARIELRVPDSSGNLYLSLAAIIAAGKRGIEEGLPDVPELPEQTNLYTMSATEKAARGIRQLPSSLYEAWYIAFHSPFVRGAVPMNIRGYFFSLFLQRSINVRNALRQNGVEFTQGLDPKGSFISEDMVGLGMDRRVKIGRGSAILGNGIYIKGDNIQIRENCKIGGDVKVLTEGSLAVEGEERKFVNGTVEIGQNVTVGKGAQIIARDNGHVEIESGCVIPDGTIIEANKDDVLYGRMRDGEFMIYRRRLDGIGAVPSFEPGLCGADI
jgi:glutamine synthetase